MMPCLSRAIPSLAAFMRLSVIIAAVAAAMAAVPPAQAAFMDGNPVMAMKDMKSISLARLVSDTRSSRVVFIGERPGTPDHHELAFDIVRRFVNDSARLMIAIESIPSESQPLLDSWIAGTIDRATFTTQLAAMMDSPADPYLPLFEFAQRSMIRLVGLDIPRSVKRKLSASGAAALTPAERAGLPASVSCDADDSLLGIYRRYYDLASLSPAQLTAFCESRTLAGRLMARRIVTSLQENPGAIMIVIASIPSASRKGIPLQVGKEKPIPARSILPATTGVIERNDASPVLADFFIMK